MRNRKRRASTKAIAAGIGIAIAAGSGSTASAATVALTNAGFETDNIPLNGTIGTPTGWVHGGGGHNTVDRAAYPAITTGHSSDQYWLAYNSSASFLQQDTALQWSSVHVGDTLTVGAWTTYRDQGTTYPNANIAFFWLNDVDGSGLNSGGINPTTAGLLGGGATVLPNVWTYREWTYTVTQPVLTNATDASPWGAVNVQLGIANSGGTMQVAFDDVTLTWTPVPEPSGPVLGGAALGFGLLRRKRRS